LRKENSCARCDPLEIVAEFLDQFSALAQPRLFLCAEFGEITSSFRDEQHRSIREPGPYLRITSVRDYSLDCGFGDAITREAAFSEDQGGRGSKARGSPAFLDARHSTDHSFRKFAVTRMAARTACAWRVQPSMRLDPGGAAELVNFESAVIGERRDVCARKVEGRLEPRIFFEGSASLRSPRRDPNVGQRKHFDSE
jgi:hypothetical protein